MNFWTSAVCGLNVSASGAPGGPPPLSLRAAGEGHLTAASSAEPVDRSVDMGGKLPFSAMCPMRRGRLSRSRSIGRDFDAKYADQRRWHP
jgi:hypothetical protein